MHKVKLISSKEKTELFLDGIPLHDSCIAFTLRKQGGEIPVAELILKCDVDIESEADLNMQSEGIQDVYKRQWVHREQVRFRRRKRAAGAVQCDRGFRSAAEQAAKEL